LHSRKCKFGIGTPWRGQRVTVIETTSDNVVILDRDAVEVLREFILGSVVDKFESPMVAP
jgi:hypothetical protein